MRHISFSLTTQQVRDKTKDVTRRIGWTFLKPGARLMAIEKGQGLKKGEKVKRICEIEVVTIKREPLRAILDYPITEIDREGFGYTTRYEFVELFLRANGGTETQIVTRIEFKYV
jgi:hypothetical protein